MANNQRGCLGIIALSLLTPHLGCFGIVALLLAIAFAAFVAVKIAKVVVPILLAVGVLLGAGITLRNYALALYHNIKPEKVTP